MIGDIALVFKKWFDTNFCIHQYEERTAKTMPPTYYRECKKCGRVR